MRVLFNMVRRIESLLEQIKTYVYIGFKNGIPMGIAKLKEIEWPQHKNLYDLARFI